MARDGRCRRSLKSESTGSVGRSSAQLEARETQQLCCRVLDERATERTDVVWNAECNCDAIEKLLGLA